MGTHSAPLHEVMTEIRGRRGGGKAYSSVRPQKGIGVKEVKNCIMLSEFTFQYA